MGNFQPLVVVPQIKPLVFFFFFFLMLTLQYFEYFLDQAALSNNLTWVFCCIIYFISCSLVLQDYLIKQLESKKGNSQVDQWCLRTTILLLPLNKITQSACILRKFSELYISELSLDEQCFVCSVSELFETSELTP